MNEYEVDTYSVNIFLPNFVAIPAVRVSLGTIGGSDIDVLLGMDIITIGDFAITNQEKKTTFSFRFPSLEKIDFVAKINASKPTTQQTQKSREEARKERNRRKKMNKKQKKTI